MAEDLIVTVEKIESGIEPADLGLGTDTAHVQCPDPCSITNGGTVIFKIERGR